MKVIRAAAYVGLALSATAANAADFLNGSFELGVDPGSSYTTLSNGSNAITGWVVGGHSIDYIGGYWPALDGTRSIDLAGSGIGSISQTFDTVNGATYNVRYWIGRNPDGGVNPRTGFVDVGGVQTQFTYYGSGSLASMLWEENLFTFTASGASTTLTFSADPGTSAEYYGAALDNVSVVAARGINDPAVPEPATWATLLFGFGAIGFGLRQRKSPGRLRALAA